MMRPGARTISRLAAASEALIGGQSGRVSAPDSFPVCTALSRSARLPLGVGGMLVGGLARVIGDGAQHQPQKHRGGKVPVQKPAAGSAAMKPRMHGSIPIVAGGSARHGRCVSERESPHRVDEAFHRCFTQ